MFVSTSVTVTAGVRNNCVCVSECGACGHLYITLWGHFSVPTRGNSSKKKNKTSGMFYLVTDG